MGPRHFLLTLGSAIGLCSAIASAESLREFVDSGKSPKFLLFKVDGHNLRSEPKFGVDHRGNVLFPSKANTYFPIYSYGIQEVGLVLQLTLGEKDIYAAVPFHRNEDFVLCENEECLGDAQPFEAPGESGSTPENEPPAPQSEPTTVTKELPQAVKKVVVCEEKPKPRQEDLLDKGKFLATIYHTADEAEHPDKAKTEELLDRRGRVLAKVSRSAHKEARMEGNIKLNDGRILNYERAGVWKVVKNKKAELGYGVRMIPLKPYRTCAVDPASVKIRSMMYIPKMRGMKLPDGCVHDGYCLAANEGGNINGRHVDLFAGLGKKSYKIYHKAGISNRSYVQIYVVNPKPSKHGPENRDKPTRR